MTVIVGSREVTSTSRGFRDDTGSISASSFDVAACLRAARPERVLDVRLGPPWDPPLADMATSPSVRGARDPPERGGPTANREHELGLDRRRPAVGPRRVSHRKPRLVEGWGGYQGLGFTHAAGDPNFRRATATLQPHWLWDLKTERGHNGPTVPGARIRGRTGLPPLGVAVAVACSSC